MRLSYPNMTYYVTMLNGDKLYVQNYDIGPWDMQTDIVHFLNYVLPFSVLVFGITVVIGSDAQLATRNYTEVLPGINNVTGNLDSWIENVTSTQAIFGRRTAGKYDNIAYNDAVLNRGVACLLFKPI